MIKRPLLWVLLGFVLGEVLEQSYCNMAMIIGVLVFVILCVIGSIKKAMLPSKWMLLLPFFIILGGICFSETTVYDEVWETLESKRSMPLIGTVYDRQPGKLYLTDVIVLDHNQRCVIKGNVIVYSMEDIAKIGEIIELTGKLARIEGPTNPGQFDGRIYYGAKGIYYSYTAQSIQIRKSATYQIKEQLYQVRSYFSNVFLKLTDSESAGVITAMVLGEKELLEPETKDRYARNGIAHILSISGLHVSLLGYQLFIFLKKRGTSYLVSGIVAGLVLVLYCILTGMGDASLRAMIMLLLRMTGDVIGRTYDGLSAMSFAGLMMLIKYPLRLFDAGFLLSYSAIVAIAITIPILSEKLPRALASSLGITISTIPIVTWFYFDLSTYSILINLLVIPLTTLLLPFGMLGLFIGCGSLFLGKIMMLPVIAIIKLVELICRMFETLPFHLSTIGRMSLFHCIIYYIILIICLYFLKKKKWKCLLIIFCGCISFMSFQPKNQMQIICMDVGQGDGIFIKTPSGTSYLLDGGSTSQSNVGKYTLMPVVKYYGVGSLDYVILSHMDEDHISGARELIDLMPIKHLVMPNIAVKDEVYLKLVQQATDKGIKVLYMGKGDQIKDQDITFTSYHPSISYPTSNINDASLVIGVQYKGFHGLFTGDLEAGGEKAILPELSNIAFLKVGHHGSNTSSSNEFLNAIRPEIAVVSCGRKNTYGHPHKDVVARLDQTGATTYMTMNQGAIMIKTNGETIRIKTMLD